MPTADVNIDEPRIDVQTAYFEKDMIRSVPGARWDPTQKVWHTPLSWGACLALRGVFGHTLQIGDRLSAWARQEKQVRIEPANEIRMATNWAGGTQLEDDLYPFQDVGAEFLARARQALLADEMGTGKTVQTIRALRRLRDWRGENPFPALVVAPNTAKQSWYNEWKRWDPSVEVMVVRGSAAQRRKVFDEAWTAIELGSSVAVIINIEAVRVHSRLAPYGNIRLGDNEKDPKELNRIPWRTVVIDEAHRMKDPKTKQTRACWAVQHGETVVFRYALTGTPIANHVGDLWSIMHGIAPGDYPTKTTWVDRYCTPPEAPVWMADGTFKPIGDVVVGDEVVGFSKEINIGRGVRPRYGPTRVLAVNRHRADRVRVTLASGKTLICTPDHKWLTRWTRIPDPITKRKNGPRVMKFETVAVGRKLRPVIEVPEPSYKPPSHAAGQAGRKAYNEFTSWDPIVKVEPIGRGPVVSLTTETQTYIVYGMASHNCMLSWSPFGDMEIVGVRPDTAEEFYGILNPRMRRMPKALVLPFLPEKVRPVRYVEMGPKQAKAYKEIESQMATKLDDGEVLFTTSNLAQATRLLQFSSSYATIDEAGEVKLTEPSPKLDAMEEVLDEIGDQSIVIVAQSRQLIDMAAARLDKRGVTYRMIVGGVPEQERQVNIDDFQAGRAQVMLMTLQAGGVGITLTRAGIILFLQRSWSMIDNKQCEDRVHRIGSEIHDKIVVIDLVTTGSVEEEQIPRLHSKMMRLEQVVRDREVMAANGDQLGVARLDAEVASIEQDPLWQGTAQTAQKARHERERNNHT